MTRVLCYSPYGRWSLHAQWEMTILNGLRGHGAEVEYVLCDGLFSDCDVFWAATEPRPANACVMCQAQVTQQVARMGMDFTWLGRYLRLEERDEAKRWAKAIARDELADARYGDWAVAEWVRGSLHSHFRSSVLDVTDPAVEEAYRSYLFSGLVACFALDRLLSHHAPDVLFMFNGRQSSTRVALELARARGIRVVCHERGTRKETLTLTEDESCLGLDQRTRLYWEQWGDVPLSDRELEDVVQHLHEREHGLKLSWNAFTGAPEPAAASRAALGLRPDAPTWVLFTSSDDEVTSETAWQGDFDSQREWIERTIAWAARNPDVDLVVRVHPNTGSKRSLGRNRRQLAEMEQVSRDLPPNVRWVSPDDELSTYTLMELATVGLAYHSTVGLELACKGKATVMAAGGFVTGLPFVHTVERAAGYEAMLDALRPLPPGAVFDEVTRLALRYAYGYFFRYPVAFPLVRMTSSSTGRLRWEAPDELVPGADAGLDRCARIILEGEPVCPPPAAEARSTAAEDAYLGTAAATFTAVAFADELIADVSLLRAWAEAFPASTGVTLAIDTPAEATERLVEAVSRAGLPEADGPDLVAVDGLAEVPGAVYSRHERPIDAPRFDEHTLAELRALVL
jgi:hypothetical protein